jgi:peptidoglycan/xylan/chitin deacetylase (PgdA/CDA1 family)
MKPLRLDRWVTLHLARVLARGRNGGRGPRVPILMYHSISEDPGDRRHPYFQTHTTPRRFAEHMSYLRRKGYRSVFPSEVGGLLAEEASEPGPRVVITFDDGFRDVLTQALPVLRANGLSATVYLPTDYVGATRCTFKGIPCLTWPEVRELREQGIRFGSHSASHPNLVTLDRTGLEREIFGSTAALREALGDSPTCFSYPYAFPETDRRFCELLKGLLTGAGYTNAVTTSIGTADRTGDAFFMRRLPVNDADDLSLFQAKLEGAYDWLHAAQYLVKRAKKLLEPVRRRPAAGAH